MTSYNDKMRYCIGCRGEHNHFYNSDQMEFECSNCGLLALDEQTPLPKGPKNALPPQG